ncbi:MAG TPA: sensor histidine kinase, partial [Actinomycetes bacterium]|nr:sensor histidine kinase [Actinomycetes bacterium]
KVAAGPADNASVIPKSMRVFLAAEAVFTLGYFLLPPSPPKAACYTAAGMSSVVAVVVGVRIYRPRQPLAWHLLAAGLFMFSAGDTINNGYEWVLRTEAPFPSVADPVYLAFFPLLAAGLLLLIRARTPGRDRTSLIDAVIIATGVGLLTWVFLMVPYVRAPDLTLLQRLVSIGYPLEDVLLLAVAVRLWRAGTQSTTAFRLLTAGLAALLIGDTVYGLSQLTVGWVPGGALDLIWIVFYAGLGAAALHPSMRSLSEPTPPAPPRLTGSRRALLTAATLMAPAMLVIQSARHQPLDVGVNAAGSVVLFVLLTARMTALAGQAADQAARQQERERAVGRILTATQQERQRLAAELHDGPVQELTAMSYGLERVGRRLQTQNLDVASELLSQQQEALATVTRTLRHLLAELRPPALDQHGLAGALKLHGDSFARQSKVNVNVDAHVDERPAPEVETIVYRVVQEALTNVAKHAQASNVWVRLAANQHTVDLTVRDDGIGFDPATAAQLLEDGHYGLAGMRERVELGAGRLELDSQPGQGTCIHVALAPQFTSSVLEP